MHTHWSSSSPDVDFNVPNAQSHETRAADNLKRRAVRPFAHRCPCSLLHAPTDSVRSLLIEHFMLVQVFRRYQTALQGPPRSLHPDLYQSLILLLAWSFSLESDCRPTAGTITISKVSNVLVDMVQEVHVDPATGHYPSPYSLSPLGPVLKSGLLAPGLLGLLSVITTLGLLSFIIYRFWTWQKHYKSQVFMNQYILLCMNLLIADFIQAVSFLFSFHWIKKNGIFAPSSACFVQGFLLNIGDLTSGFFVMAIAFHTFYTAVKGRRVGHVGFMISVAAVWSFALILSIIGPIEYRDKYFVRAGAWCWAGEQYSTDRLALHYIWIFIVQFGTIIIYIAVLVKLRAAVAAVVPSIRIQSQTYAKVDRAAKMMVLYPLAYIILTLPLSAGRMWSMAHHEKSLPDTYQIVAGALLASCGWVDTLLYTLTRKSLIDGGGERSSRRVRFGNAKSSSQDPSRDDPNGGSILQTRTVTVTGQVFAMETIDEERRGRHDKRYNKDFESRTGHSPTGSLDPIMTGGGHLGVNSDKVGTEVQVTSTALEQSDDETSSFDEAKSHTPDTKLKFKDFSKR